MTMVAIGKLMMETGWKILLCRKLANKWSEQTPGKNHCSRMEGLYRELVGQKVGKALFFLISLCEKHFTMECCPGGSTSL